jgi:hypothetical protein
VDPNAPPPPWFFLALFPVLAASAGIVIVSIGATLSRIRRGKTVVPLAPPVPDAQVARLQAEMDELRLQVERLTAAESFYAQLQYPGAGTDHARLAGAARAGAGSA